MKRYTAILAVGLALSLIGSSSAKPHSILVSGEIVNESVATKTNSQPEKEIKSGDTIRLFHLKTGARLHSHPKNYGHPHSSGQQQVVAYTGKDYNDLWIVRGSGASPVKDGDQIRLEHASTKQWLHSHLNIPAPLTTSQQEVTGWGGGTQTDSNDLWRVEVEEGSVWTIDKHVRLIHVATNAALHSHDIRGPEWLSGQQEVTALPFPSRDDGDFWTAVITKDEVAPFVQPLTPSAPLPLPSFPIRVRGDKVFENGGGADWVVQVQISSNGRIDMNSNIKAHRSLNGWCGQFAVYLLDGDGNVLGRYGMGPDHQWCVDGSGVHPKNETTSQAPV